jgi:chitodextrinase
MGKRLSFQARVCGVIALFAMAGCAYGGRGSGDADDSGADSGFDSTAQESGPADGASDSHVVQPDAGRDSGAIVESGPGEGGDDAANGDDATGADSPSGDASEGGPPFDAADGPTTVDASDASNTDANDASSADASDATVSDANDSGGADSSDGAPMDVADTTPPTVPTGLAKTGATTTTISLGWTASTDPDSPVAGYKIFRNATQVGTATSAAYTDTGLTVMTSYSYTVSAYDPAGNDSAQSAALVASTTADTTPPSVPTGLAETGATTTTISLGWTASTDPDSPVTGYKVYRNGTQVGTPIDTGFTDIGLTDGTSYSYTVSAYDPSGNNSAQSAPLVVSTPSCTILVTTNTYGVSSTGTTSPYDGYLTYQNKGTGAETNPVLTFDLPAGATMDMKQCTLSNFTAPGITAVSCTQSGTTVHMNFTGLLASTASIATYYTTQNSTEAAATNVTVTAASCP